MARAVSLSDDAFRALREEKQPGESDSDVVLRLRREARARRRDARRFLRSKVPFAFEPEALERNLGRARAADARNPWDA